MAFSKPRREVEYRFLLVGKSGSGKSSTANNIMGEKLFTVSLGLSAGTKTCEVRKSSKPQKGVTFRIADTPGLFDPEKSNEEIREEIIKAATALHPGLHAVLYVLKVDRYTQEERSTFNHLKNLFDENILKYVVIIFTKGDELKRSGKSLQSLVDEAGEMFKEVVRECDHRVLVFNNAKRDAKDTQNLLEMVYKIQKDNGELPYCCPLQDHVNVNLQRRATVRMQNRIDRDRALREKFDKMEEDARNAEREYDDETKHEENIMSEKKMTETMIVKLKAKEVEERERAEREKQERAEKERKSQEEKKKEEEEHEEKKREERERRRKEEERKVEEERERKKQMEELKEKQKECEELQRQLDAIQKKKEEKQKMKEKYEEKLQKERKKFVAEEREATKEDVVQGKEKHWIGQVAGGLWQGAKGYFGF